MYARLRQHTVVKGGPVDAIVKGVEEYAKINGTVRIADGLRGQGKHHGVVNRGFIYIDGARREQRSRGVVDNRRSLI